MVYFFTIQGNLKTGPERPAIRYMNVDLNLHLFSFLLILLLRPPEALQQHLHLLLFLQVPLRTAVRIARYR